jgi:glycolate oxidase FAD binding subunit
MDILSRLQSEFGDAVSPRIANENDAVDGVQPQAIAAPRDEETAQALVHWCGRENIAFVPRGGGSKLHIGAPPSRCDLIISTEKLTQIFDHDEGNATVQVGAGITLWNLDEAVKLRRQFVPIFQYDVDSQDTLGGCVASNFYDGSTMKYGSPRDLVTGLHAVLSDGRLIKAGSKVVKNVSGYDLNKLLIGSYGTLGLITEVTVRLMPNSQCLRSWLARFSSWNAAIEHAHQIVNGPFEPTSITAVCYKTRAQVSASFSGSESVVLNQIDTIRSQLGPLKEYLLPSIENATEQNIESRHGQTETFLLRAKLPLQATLSWIDVVRNQGFDRIEWHCALGLAFVYYYEEVPNIPFLRAEAEKLGGFLVVERAPIEMKTPELVWGKPRGDFALMKKLKQSFDAANVCAPGRFIGRL